MVNERGESDEVEGTLILELEGNGKGKEGKSGCRSNHEKGQDNI